MEVLLTGGVPVTNNRHSIKLRSSPTKSDCVSVDHLVIGFPLKLLIHTLVAFELASQLRGQQTPLDEATDLIDVHGCTSRVAKASINSWMILTR